MSHEDDLKELIVQHKRRLHKLKEQQAIAGISVDPKILIEIEDIEATIAALQAELAALVENSTPAELPGSLCTPAKGAVPQASPDTLSKRFSRIAQPTLTFRFRGADGKRHPLTLRGAAPGELPGSFTPPYNPITWQAIMLALEPNFQWAETPPEMQAVLQPLSNLARIPETVGAALAASLLADEAIRSEFEAALDRAEQSRQPLPVELRFDSGSEILAGLPWELLYYNGRFLVADASITLSRFPEGAGPPTLALAELPLRVLLVLAEPVEASPIFPERAREELLHGLRSLDEEGGVIVDLLRPPTFETLIEAASNGGYHVLVFYGHGGYAEASGGLLLFEDEFGGPALIPASDLGAALRNTEVRLVLLGACQSARVPDLSGLTIWHGVAPALLRAGVPLALGMQVSMRVDAALAFIRQFALSLAVGKPVGEAVGDARKPLIQRKYGRAWFIPALYGRPADGDRLFDPTQPLPAATADLRASLKAQRAEIARLEQAIGGVGMLRQPGEIARLRAAKSDFARTRAELARHAPGGYAPVTSPLYGVPSNPVFVGRAAELQQVSRRFSSGRPVVVWGAGGLGKTALAIEIAHRQGWRFRGGVLWLDCRGGPALDTLLDQIGAFCGLEAMDQVKPEQKETTVRWKLAELGERCLLVWDNAEEVWDNAGVRRFIDNLPPNSQLLITTRDHPERAMWEMVELEPLLDEAMQTLFYRLASSAGVKIGTQADLEAIPPMLRWLQGHPLALMLIVPLMVKRGVKRVWAELQQRPLQGVAAAFELSYARLSETQQKLFARLSVFTIPFEWEAAEALMPGQADVADSLDVLVQRALLTFDGARYAYHALLRQYAYAKLREMEDSRPVHKLAAEYLQAKITDKERSGTPAEGLEMVDQWEWAEEWRQFAQSACVLGGSLHELGYWGEIRERLKRARAVVKVHLGSPLDLEARLLIVMGLIAHKSSDWDEAIALMEEAANLYQTARDERGLAATFVLLGDIYRDKGEWGRAIELYQQALPILERLGVSLAGVYNELGQVYWLKGEREQAIEFYQQSLNIFERLEDRRGQADVYNNLGLVYAAVGEWERAIEFYQKDLEISGQPGNRYGLAQTYENLGYVYRNKGEWERAINFYQQSLEIREWLGDSPGIAQTYNGLGSVYRYKGEWERAIGCFQQALPILERLGDRQGLAHTYQGLGIVYQEKGEWERAINFYQQSLAIFERLQDHHGLAQIYTNLGTFCFLKKEWGRAFEYYQQALPIMERLGNHHGLAGIYHQLGNIYNGKGEWERAIKFYQKSIEIRERLEDHHGLAQTYMSLGIVYSQKGEWGRAFEYYQQALPIMERLGDRHGLALGWTNVGVLYLRTGQTEAAKPFLARASSVLTELGSPDAGTAFYELVQACGSVEAAVAYIAQRVSEEPPASLFDEDFKELFDNMIRACRGDAELGEQLWQFTQQMSRDASLPAEGRILGRVLTLTLAGERSPDLAGLSPEVAGAVREMLGEIRK